MINFFIHQIYLCFCYAFQFPKGKYVHNSTNRTDFKNYGTVAPDVILRRKAKLGSEGIPADMLFRHHGEAYNDMKITLYDENFNGRWKEKNLPALRDWDGQALGWLPEKSDKPLTGDDNKRFIILIIYTFSFCYSLFSQEFKIINSAV